MKTEWHSGPPTSIGWWQASINCEPDILRWWNGRDWSVPAKEGYSEEQIIRSSQIAAIGLYCHKIYWKHRPKSWPKRSKT